jgi:hypothetical protein
VIGTLASGWLGPVKQQKSSRKICPVGFRLCASAWLAPTYPAGRGLVQCRKAANQG